MGLEQFIHMDELQQLINTLVKHCENNEAPEASKYIHKIILDSKKTNKSLQVLDFVKNQL
jgi:hypothetical protein